MSAHALKMTMLKRGLYDSLELCNGQYTMISKSGMRYPVDAKDVARFT